MDKITGKSLYEKTCPPGKVNAITGSINPNWGNLNPNEKRAWNSVASDMEAIANEEASDVRQA